MNRLTLPLLTVAAFIAVWYLDLFGVWTAASDGGTRPLKGILMAVLSIGLGALLSSFGTPRIERFLNRQLERHR
jgi:hypothetical protein